MAKPVEKKEFQHPAGTAARAAEIANRRYGQGTVIRGGGNKREVPRLMTGVFDLTLKTGGGWPLWRLSRIKGPEHGGKTSLTISAMKMAHMICWRCFNVADFCTCEQEPLRQVSCYEDVETKFDPAWADAFGLPKESYHLINADSGGDFLDIADSFLQADDCGLVVIDSAAMLLPTVEIERPIGDMKMASHASLMTDACKKLRNRLGRELKRGHPCLVLVTNQLRSKVGVTFGSTETEAGGHALRFLSSLGVRVGKVSTPEELYKGENDLKLAQRHRYTIDKDQVWTFGGSGEFIRAREDIHSKKTGKLLFKKGQIADVKDIDTWLTTTEMYKEGTKGGFLIPGFVDEEMKKMALLDKLKVDEPLYYQLHKEIVDRVRQSRTET